ncbi:MAG: 3-oxoacyl-[acyl-carrier-protein] reductase [Defluviitaleaceae bacterium]|nr:3-oxoacyl-[acyl-carrier-protein] reductase [Defluviitaleaceae bacterium]
MLKGKTAVVTGGSRGIGKAVALAFAENGADIAVIFSGNEAAANEVVAGAESFGIKARAYQCDVSDFSQTKDVCAKIFKEFGKIDILVNNAGITKDGLLLSMKEDDFDAVINVNLKGAFNFTRHLARYILKSPVGRIINISSVSGIAGNVGQGNYSASKAGLIGLTKTSAKEFASRNVTCNAIAPGFIETDMTSVLPEEILQNVKTAVPLKRMGKPEEIAALALFLASDAASYITGEVIKADGGMYA